MQYGLLGRKLGHSYSPQIHQLIGIQNYTLCEVEPEDLPGFFQKRDFIGINVTIPYKKTVIPFCDKLSPIAEELGAVNTIVKCKDGTLIGHNTDYYGFSSMLKHSGIDVTNKKTLVLGNGGAAATVLSVLTRFGARVVQISRSGSNNYSNLHQHSDASVIINATPVGMYPENGHTPVNLDQFQNLEGVLDLIYNPSQTKLLLDAEEKDIKWENGLWMLIAQAKESAEWFLNSKFEEQIIKNIHKTLLSNMKNIVLIGMPGVGKSTIGQIIAQKTGRVFIDSDTVIESYAQKPIPLIFNEQGEDAFRSIESKVMEQIGKKSGCVIATGGGCVTRAENYNYLHQNGIIIWIERNLSSLPVEGRPLSLSTPLQSLYKERRPLYSSFSDYCVANNESAEEAADRIIDALKKVVVK